MPSQENHYQQFLQSNPYPRVLKDTEWQKLSVHYAGQTLLDFSSNDYLGLAYHPCLIERSKEFTERYGTGSGSSRLVRGNHIIYEEIERKIAQALNKEAALILSSGYQANLTVLEALLNSSILGAKPLVFCDKYAHASIQMAAHHSAQLIRFRHNDVEHLEKLLQRHQVSCVSKFILVETLYSMDGDQANLREIAELAQRYHAFLYVDDAHAVGVFGKTGWGLAELYAEHIDVVMGTFSKALGCFGGYIACSKTVRDYLINKCRGLIYSTALPPSTLGAIAAAVDLVPTLHEERARLLANAQKLRTTLLSLSLDIGSANTHIVPWIIRDSADARSIGDYLLSHGIFAAAIQPPTVPALESRIRFCSNAGHQEQDFAHLRTLLQAVTS